jgi:hypothetical protein
MDIITTANGRVGHIVDGIRDYPGGRYVDTLCGQSYVETEIRVDNTLNTCASCTKALNGSFDDDTGDEVLPTDNNDVDPEPAPVVETVKDDKATKTADAKSSDK